MNLVPGTLVRYTGIACNIPAGELGTVTGQHHALTDCPVVDFPRVRGPFSRFIITRPETELRPVVPGMV